MSKSRDEESKSAHVLSEHDNLLNQRWERHSKYSHLYLPYIQKHDYLQLIYTYWKDSDNTFNDTQIEVIRTHLFPELSKSMDAGVKTYAKHEGKEHLSRLRTRDATGDFRLFRIGTHKFAVYSHSMLLWLWDEIGGCINTVIAHFGDYYGKYIRTDTIQQTQHKIEAIKKWALLRAILDQKIIAERRLALLDSIPRGLPIDPQVDSLPAAFNLSLLKKDPKKLPISPYDYYGFFFLTDTIQLFKEYFWQDLGCPRLKLEGLSSEQFRSKFEAEWERAKKHADDSYGFIVIPAFSGQDMIRYAQDSEGNRRIIREIQDYVALKICPRLRQTLAFVDQQRFNQWRALVVQLFRSSILQAIKTYEKNTDWPSLGKDKRKLFDNLVRSVDHWIVLEYNFMYNKKSSVMGHLPTSYELPQGRCWEFSTRPENIQYLQEKPGRRNPHILRICYEKLEWVRPSYFIEKRLETWSKSSLLNKPDLSPDKGKAALWQQWTKSGRHSDAETHIREINTESIERWDKRFVAPNKEPTISSYLLLDEEIPTLNERNLYQLTNEYPQTFQFSKLFGNKRFLCIEQLVAILNTHGYLVTSKTLRTMEERGEIRFYHLLPELDKGRFRQRPIRFFPCDEISSIEPLFVKDKQIADIAGVRADYMPKIKIKKCLLNLPKIEQKKALLQWALNRRQRLSNKTIPK